MLVAKVKLNSQIYCWKAIRNIFDRECQRFLFLFSRLIRLKSLVMLCYGWSQSNLNMLSTAGGSPARMLKHRDRKCWIVSTDGMPGITYAVQDKIYP